MKQLITVFILISPCILPCVNAGFYGSAPGPIVTPNPLVEAMEFPSIFDWRENGGYTPARTQNATGPCYPCWAFSLIGAAESVFKIAMGPDIDLSEQQLIDCNTNGYGCNGGFVSGWTALRDYGAVLESCYPFIAEDTECRQSECEPVGWIAGVYPVAYTVKSIKYALLHHGCLSCSMTVYNDFMSYSEGCYENPGTQPINHGVVIVGWDDTMCDGEGAWMVKNSWGENWGDGGVAYMKYGTANIGRHSQWFEYIPAPPDSSFHYRFFMPDTDLTAEEWCVLERCCGNASANTIDFLEFIILDIHGQYWFYPNFSRDPDWQENSLTPDTYRADVQVAFQWPANTGSLANIRFWGGMLDTTTHAILGWDMVEWSASE